MHSEKEEKFMETHDAIIERSEGIVKLVLKTTKEEYQIVLSEDEPNKIKEVFNNLIIELKSGKFQFDLKDDEDDLFKNVCKEYITQLNSEIANVYGQMKSYDLLKKDA